MWGPAGREAGSVPLPKPSTPIAETGTGASNPAYLPPAVPVGQPTPPPAKAPDEPATSRPGDLGPALVAGAPEATPVPPFAPPAIAETPRPASVPGPVAGVPANPEPARPPTGVPPTDARESRAQAVRTLAVPTGAQTPTVYLEKIGPASVAVGKPLAYEIIARNAGSTPVLDVRVEDRLPDGARFVGAEPAPEARGEMLIWNLGPLEAGAERRIKVEIQPAGEGEVLSTATVTFSAASGLKTQVTRPKVTLALAGPESAQVGDPVGLQIQIANVGTGTANGLVLHATLSPGVSHEKGNRIDADLGSLAPGESRTVPLTVTAVRGGRQLSEVSVTGDDDVQGAASSAVLVTEPVLAVRATSPRRRFLHRETVFDLEVANAGTGPAANVRLGDILPEGLDFLSASEGGAFDPATRTVVWQISHLAPGQKQNFTIKTAPRTPGDLINRAVVRDDRGLEAKVETAVHVEGLTALLLEVVDVEDPAAVGADVGYEVRVLNQGTAPNTGVRVCATIPAGMTFKSAAGPVPHHVEGQQLIFEPLPALAPRADLLYRLCLVGQQPGDMRLKVQLSSDQVLTPITKEESTHVYADPDELSTSSSTGAWKSEPAKSADRP
jgi:uncharacterized repeat protein (TIGR01451 family)